ncbi:CLUMA_CG000254, isoform A [Clunio marinus]|uniref:CLUMA_CG000254, isoform A n=1 Tax=Clunio marinus TaxID=568069 RepID=A0A1J1HET2_9DIPT|nr:CLUMA_CG000254, isoform A [Clunio marinus]
MPKYEFRLKSFKTTHILALIPYSDFSISQHHDIFFMFVLNTYAAFYKYAHSTDLQAKINRNNHEVCCEVLGRRGNLKE